MTRPKAVLLDAGGVFVLPERRRILGALERAGCHVDEGRLDAAHYTAAAGFTTNLDVEGDWAGCWEIYLARYVDACGLPGTADRDEVHRHLDSEFADAALWVEVIEGAADGLRALAATGIALGVVSNADGLMGERLRGFEILQVGPGPGVDVACVVDSGALGVMKPDPRIFDAALDVLGVDASDTWYVGDMPAIDVVGARRAGIRPFVMDPLGLHTEADYDRTPSLGALAASIDGG